MANSIRRHLTEEGIERFIAVLGGLGVPAQVAPGLRERAMALLKSGSGRFLAAIEARSPDEQAILKNRGTWSVGLVFDSTRDNPSPNRDFLNRVLSANPSYTGWPIWLDSRNFREKENRPRVIDKAWEILIVSFAKGWSNHVDFMRFDPRGELYLLRLLQDDLQEKIAPGTVLDVILVVIRVAETIAVGLSIGKALGLQSTARLGFGFQWKGLSGRRLELVG